MLLGHVNAVSARNGWPLPKATRFATVTRAIFRQRLLREESLVRGDEHVGEGKQAREFVVVENLPG